MKPETENIQLEKRKKNFFHLQMWLVVWEANYNTCCAFDDITKGSANILNGGAVVRWQAGIFQGLVGGLIPSADWLLLCALSRRLDREKANCCYANVRGNRWTLICHPRHRQYMTNKKSSVFTLETVSGWVNKSRHFPPGIGLDRKRLSSESPFCLPCDNWLQVDQLSFTLISNDSLSFESMSHGSRTASLLASLLLFSCVAPMNHADMIISMSRDAVVGHRSLLAAVAPPTLASFLSFTSRRGHGRSGEKFLLGVA